MRFTKTKAQYRQEIVSQYRANGESWPTDAKTIAAWAIRMKLWQMPRRNEIDACAKELSEAMREEYITDPQGRRVRKKHAVREKQIFSDGTHKQMTFWIDMEDGDTKRMEEAFQQRRGQVFLDCRQLKTDCDSYNKNWNKQDTIQMSFDFTEDLIEAEQPTDYDDLAA